MSKRTTTVWTCDFCKRSEEIGRPDTWISVSVHPGAEHEDVMERRHVCPACIETVFGVEIADQREWIESSR